MKVAQNITQLSNYIYKGTLKREIDEKDLPGLL
jgi:hypothetical protein